MSQPRTPYGPTISPMTTMASRAAAIALLHSDLRHTDRARPACVDQAAAGAAGAAGATGFAWRLTRPATVSDSARRDACQNVMRSTASRSDFLVLGGDGVVEPDALDETAVAAVARIRDDHVEERTLLGAAPG